MSPKNTLFQIAPKGSKPIFAHILIFKKEKKLPKQSKIICLMENVRHLWSCGVSYLSYSKQLRRFFSQALLKAVGPYGILSACGETKGNFFTRVT